MYCLYFVAIAVVLLLLLCFCATAGVRVGARTYDPPLLPGRPRAQLVKPDAVFVELCQQRYTRMMQARTPAATPPPSAASPIEQLKALGMAAPKRHPPKPP